VPPVGSTHVPFAIESYRFGVSGKFLSIPVAMDGAVVHLLLDTGSSGLRVFQSRLPQRPATGPSRTYLFGSARFSGPDTTASVKLGQISIPAPVTYQLVTDVQPSAVQALFDQNEIDGVLGVALSADAPQEIYSPLAQLSPELSSGFIVRTAGYDSNAGELVLGAAAERSPEFATLALSPDGRRAGAWNDKPQVCCAVAGAPTEPHCLPTLIDTGANEATLQVTALPETGTTPDGAGGAFLARGNTFEAVAAAFDMQVTITDPSATSLQAFHLRHVMSASGLQNNLGIELFFRYEVLYDTRAGRLGFKLIGGV
jgi:hypothetical protein